MTTIKIDSLEFKKLIKKTKPFISTEETRYYLNGLFIEFDGKDNVTATATNGYILIHTKVRLMEEASVGERDKFAVIVPRLALNHLYKIIGKETGGLGALVTVEGSTILFDFDEVQYRTKLIDGTFPDYNKVIPSGKETINEGFNPKYLNAVLGALDGQAVNIAVDDSSSAGNPRLFSVAKDDSETKCVLMPMRI